MSIEIDLNELSLSVPFEIPIHSILPRIKSNETETSNKFTFKEIEIKEASSSIYYTQGETNLLIAIYGPKETKFKEKVKMENANIEVYIKFNKEISKEESLSFISNIKSFAKSIILTSSYPKCQINLNVNILSASDDYFILMSCIYNGLMLALSISGIDLKAMVLSKAFSFDSKSVLISLDANNVNNILNVDSNIPLIISDYEEVIEKSQKDVEVMYKRIKIILIKDLKIKFN